MRLLSLIVAFAATPLHAAAPPDWGTSREVEVQMSGFTYTPPRIELRAGEAVQLALVNDRLGARSFQAGRFFAAAEMPAQDRARLQGGGVRLKPGERLTLRLVVPAPGDYEIRSARLLQAALGLRGKIVVR